MHTNLRLVGTPRSGGALLTLLLLVSACPSPAPGPRPAQPPPPTSAPAASASAPVAPTSAVTEPRCDGLKVIRFAEPLCSKLAADTKRITLRARHRTEISVGEWVQLVCMESRTRFLARLVGVRHATWRTITAAELSDDGFSDPDQMLEIMRGYYPGIGWDDPATIYRWDRCRPCP